MKLMTLFAALICTGLVFADTPSGPVNGSKRPRNRLSPAEFRSRRDARIAAEGGLVQRKAEGKVIRVMTNTDKISVSELEKIAQEITQLLGFVVECVDGNAQSNQRTGCLIVLNEQEKGPTLLVAPEDPWASINVKNLTKDNPDDALFKLRVKKEIWRAFGYAMGAANSNMQPCLMRPIYGLKDLDSEKVAILCPEPLSSISMSAARLNIASMNKCTYKKACEEGWAPDPTNEIQKAVWEKVHATPKCPMKIEFDPKKGR